MTIAPPAMRNAVALGLITIATMSIVMRLMPATMVVEMVRKMLATRSTLVVRISCMLPSRVPA